MSTTEQSAALTDDEKARVKLTGRFVRAAPSRSILALAPGATAGYTLESGDLAGVDSMTIISVP